MRKVLITIGAVLSVLLSGAVVTTQIAATASAAACTPGAVVATPPVRLLDTRSSGAGGPLAAAESRVIPIGAYSAVFLNLTATDSTAAGYLTAYPSGYGSQPPLASMLNFTQGQTIANGVLVRVGELSPWGVRIYNGSSGTVHLIVDQTGYVCA